MGQLKLISTFTALSTSELSPHSPLTPKSWHTHNSSSKEAIEENLVYFESGELGIGEVNRFTIRIHRNQNRDKIECDETGQYVWLHVKNSELDLFRPIYITGPFTLYVDVTPRNFFHLHEFNEDIQYSSEVKPGQAFKAKLRFSHNSLIEDDLFEWQVDVVSQLTLATAFHIKFEISIGYDHHLLKKATSGKSFSNPDVLDVQLETTHDIWNKPPQDPDNPVHLVIITHGIFSNVGADMLYIRDHIEDITSKTPGSNVIIRGYNGNSGKSEKGIKYLGKRVAEFVMKTVKESPYSIDRISFVGHSLGGPVQAYAIAYIIWTKPDFFKNIVPVNFITLASPMLGITEFPTAVSIALDLGMFGVTGRDLTLRHKFPTLMKKGKKDQAADEVSKHLTTKPILEQVLISPTHELFERFVSRTLYANAIHDGIVPLRTSALFYLDWRGLGDIEILRKNYDRNTSGLTHGNDEETGGSRPRSGTVGEIPDEDDRGGQGQTDSTSSTSDQPTSEVKKKSVQEQYKVQSTPTGLQFLKKSTSMFAETKKKQKRKKLKKYLRTQTIGSESSTNESESTRSLPTSSSTGTQPESEVKIESSQEANPDESSFHVPPVASTVLTAANAILSPEPKQEYLRNPSSRPPSIFHDKLYTYSDLPPSHYSTAQKKLSLLRDKKCLQEYLARSWHKNMEWRKVLVTLKPDAHNNIAVRRRYVNAWGWGVIDHLVMNHFGKEALEKELAAVEKLKNS